MNRTLALARLVRLPNVFTAIADVSVGLLVGRTEVPLHVWITLPLASACFYSAGMAWNDYFDQHIDRIERPSRPIPSRAITPRFAGWFATILATIGLILAASNGWNSGFWSALPLVHAVALVAAILAYDGWLKSTPIGPWMMGGCRFLNVMLGFSVLSTDLIPWLPRIHAALALGLYVAGISIVARDEVQHAVKHRLVFGLVVSILGFGMISILHYKASHGFSFLSVYLPAFAIIAFLTRGNSLLHDRSPEATQKFVKTALLGIIVFDAILATGIAGPIGLVIVIWLISAVFLGHWVYST